jgi:glycerol-3-phosphate acyltransferase PlsY
VKFLVVILAGYLLGAIPFGLLIGKLLRGVDVRSYGSGRTGAANVLRVAGTRAGILTLIADVSKGIAAVLLAGWLIGPEKLSLTGLELGSRAAQVIAAWAAIAGHNWSVYIKFHGGRGVDTFFGGLIAMSPTTGIGCGVTTLLLMGLTRYISLGSILGTILTLVVMLYFTLEGKEQMEYLVYTSLAASLILFQHRDNIQRLRAGRERKLGEKAEKISGA